MNKKPILPALTISLLFFLSCEEPVANSYYSQHFWLSEGQETVISSSDEEKEPANITIQFEEVNDSRCPADAICITAGNAILTINAGGEILKLCIDDCTATGLSNTINFTVNNEAYTLQVFEVTPYPMTANEGKVKKAKLMVARR